MANDGYPCQDSIQTLQTWCVAGAVTGKASCCKIQLRHRLYLLRPYGGAYFDACPRGKA